MNRECRAVMTRKTYCGNLLWQSSLTLLAPIWDPSEPVATRPLWMQRVSGTYNFFYFHDGNKNVSELVSYQAARGVPAHYEYAPFGAVTAVVTNTAITAFNVAATNPYRFSSEYADDALGLVYYNYRHYEPMMGRWLSRDPREERIMHGLYDYCANNSITAVDCLGLKKKSLRYETDPFENDPDGKYREWSIKHNDKYQHISDLDELVLWILAETDPYCPTGEIDGDETCCHCIDYIALAGHGSSGAVELGGGMYNNFIIATESLEGSMMYKYNNGRSVHESNHDFLFLMEIIKERMCEKSTIEFVTCETGSNVHVGPLLKQFFGSGTTVILYSCAIKLIDNKVVGGSWWNYYSNGGKVVW